MTSSTSTEASIRQWGRDRGHHVEQITPSVREAYARDVTEGLWTPAEERGIDHQAYNRAVQQVVYKPATCLETIRAARTALDALEREAVIRLRRQGKGWREVGHALGVSGAAAHKKYGSLA